VDYFRKLKERKEKYYFIVKAVIRDALYFGLKEYVQRLEILQ
jgi:hypothetical protein